ncbi:uncharacterized protein EV420DRAFT_1524410 [Desarmillaria tabescens]|uniref:F-box domain-containing protein n=1 Tax=Armillaria tabescens TaxID=1929756 RepID=A0AA39TXI8_ARMTA|nr:uncharacterized protein EV420DRAFT_1524410 [Desarmillaria tabescens]KAK0462375.1 hypothetical protein EV420DRAFT_1524410 [Desarmillaria tabescens]
MDAATETCATCTLTANLANLNHILSTNDFSVPDNLHPYINGNLYPTSTVCIEIKQSLERLTKRFEEVLAHQQNIISQVALMLKKHEEAYAKTQLRAREIMDRHNYALSSPIRSLSDDLLAVIFQFTSPSATMMDQFPWIATRVCRQWRAVAYSNRILWSEFNLDSSSITDDGRGRSSSTQSEWRDSSMIWDARSWSASPEGEMERKHHEVVRPTVSKRVLSQTLEYSGSTPLTLSVDFPNDIDNYEIAFDYLDMFIAQAARWRNVRLHLPGFLFESLPLVKNGLPMLESLELVVRSQVRDPIPADTFANAQSLNSVTFDVLSDVEFIFPWKQLKELSICTFLLSPNYYLQILHDGSYLETLCLKLRPGFSELTTAKPSFGTRPQTVITLPRLRVLEIGSELSSLLNSICLPNLSSLTVHGDADSIELDLSSFIERSCSTVDNFSCSSTPIAAGFTRLLRVFPSLTSLTLCSPTFEDKAFFSAMAQKSLLPSLENFTIHDASITRDCMVPIIDMLAARQSCLKQFLMIRLLPSEDGWGQWDIDWWLEPSEKSRLEALLNAGMNIQIGIKHSRFLGSPEISYLNLGAQKEWDPWQSWDSLAGWA